MGGQGAMTKGLKGGDCVVVVVIIVVEPSGFRTWEKEGRGMTTTARGEDMSLSLSSMSTLTSSTLIPAVKHPPSPVHDCGERERRRSCCGVRFRGGIGLAAREKEIRLLVMEEVGPNNQHEAGGEGWWSKIDKDNN